LLDDTNFIEFAKNFDDMGFLFARHGVDFDEMEVGGERFLDDCAVGSGGQYGNAFNIFGVVGKLYEIHFGSVDILSCESLPRWKHYFGLIFVLVTYR
jgi:hypothetical protein